MTELYLRRYVCGHRSKRVLLNLVCSPVLLTVKRKQEKMVATFISLVAVLYPARKIDCRSSRQCITHSSLLFKRIMKKPATNIKSVYGNWIRTSRKDKSIWLSARDLHTVRLWANSHPDLWNTNHRRATLALISFCLCLFVEGTPLTFGSSNPLVSSSQHFTTVLTWYNQLSLTTYRISCWRLAVWFCFWFAADASNFWAGVGWEKKINWLKRLTGHIGGRRVIGH